MGWWEDGLQGDMIWQPSGGISKPVPGYDFINILGGSIIGSYSLNTNAELNSYYDVLINTFSLGTQFYMRFYPKFSGNSPFTNYQGEQYSADIVAHWCGAYLKKGNNIYWIEAGAAPHDGPHSYMSKVYGPSAWLYDTALFNVYWKNYYLTGGKPGGPFNCFPRGKDGAVTTNQLAIVCNSGGVDFYTVGFEYVSTQYGQTSYLFDMPGEYLFTLSSTLLNNTDLFDQEQDAYQPPEGTGEGEGGNIPSLPVSPTYPGTDIGFPTLPTGASAFGFSRLTLYKPTAAQLSDALDILYTDSDESTLETIIESCKKWWYKPEQYCISLMISPVDVTTSTLKNIKFGKYDSEVQALYTTTQFHITDCGTITVPLKFGSFIDFEPHAKVKLYLPYVGFRSINANEVLGSVIAIKYYTDMLTGSSVAMVRIQREGSNNSILYTYECNLAVQVPMTSNNYNQVVSNILQAGVSAGIAAVGVATGGMAAAPAAFAGASGAIQGAVGAGSAAGSPELTQSGQLTANVGVMCHPKPYLAVSFPVPTTPNNYSMEKGRPSNMYLQLSRCKGFTVISEIHLDIPAAFPEEIEQIRSAFKRGVYM